MSRVYISIPAQGVVADNADEVIITFFGPKGGTKAIVSLSPEAAKQLRDKLG